MYVSIYYHLSAGPLEYVHLIVTRDGHFEKESSCLKKDVKENLRRFFRKASKCLQVESTVNWPCEKVDNIKADDVIPRRNIRVDFVPISNSNDVKKIFHRIGVSPLAKLIEKTAGMLHFI